MHWYLTTMYIAVARYIIYNTFWSRNWEVEGHPDEKKKEKVRAKKKPWKTYLIDAWDVERVYIKRRLGNILIGYLRSQGYLDDGTFFMGLIKIMNRQHRGYQNWENIQSNLLVWDEQDSLHALPLSLWDWSEKTSSRFICNGCGHRTGIHWIPPLRSLSHIKRRDLRGSETAAKGGPTSQLHWQLSICCQILVEINFEMWMGNTFITKFHMEQQEMRAQAQDILGWPSAHKFQMY